MVGMPLQMPSCALSFHLCLPLALASVWLMGGPPTGSSVRLLIHSLLFSLPHSFFPRPRSGFWHLLHVLVLLGPSGGKRSFISGCLGTPHCSPSHADGSIRPPPPQSFGRCHLFPAPTGLIQTERVGHQPFGPGPSQRPAIPGPAAVLLPQPFRRARPLRVPGLCELQPALFIYRTTCKHCFLLCLMCQRFSGF